MKARLQHFMIGRYGQDDLCRFINILVLVILLLGALLLPQLTGIAFALLIICFFRIFSRNIDKRSQENYAYLKIKSNIKGWFSKYKRRFTERKTHCFFSCPSCKKTLRVPKGKGLLSITCPNCLTVFEKRS